MIDIRPLNPVNTVGNPDPLIAKFNYSEWRNLIDLAHRYGFEPPNDQIYYPRTYNHPVEIDAETSQRLYEAISAVHNDDTAPYAIIIAEERSTRVIARPDHDRVVGKLLVKKLMACAQIGAEQGGIEIRRSRDED
jgi:hypothetical protein